MIDEVRNRLQFQYETNSSEKYLVVKASSNEDVNKNHMEMIGKNSICGILPMNVVYKDDAINIFYNISSKLSLADYLKTTKLKALQVITILQGLCNAVLEAQNYFMKDKYFLFDEDYIFIEQESNQPYLVFLPFTFEVGGQDSFKDFVKTFITDLVVLENGENTSVFGIIPYLREDNFNIKDFAKRLSVLDKYPRQSNTGTVINNNDIQKNNIQNPIQVTDSKQMKNDTKNSIPNKSSKNQIPQKNLPQNYTVEKVSKTKYKSGSIIFFVVLQVVFVAIAVFGFGPAKEASGDALSAAVAFIAAFGGIDFFLFRKLFDKSKKISYEVEIKKPVPTSGQQDTYEKRIQPEKSSISSEKINMQVADISGEVRKGKVVIPKANNNKENSPINKPIDTKQEAAFTAVAPVDKTELLSSDKTMLLNIVPYLKPIDGTDIVCINNASFVIGRQEEQVHFVSNNSAVGRIHAKIITKDGEYYLIDLNSTNGTFLNGLRLNSNNEYKLTANDEVVFANSKYTFVIPGTEV